MKVSLKAARVNSGLTQKDAARAIGVDRTTVMNWELGKTEVSKKHFDLLCELYEANNDDIFLPTTSTKSETEQTIV